MTTPRLAALIPIIALAVMAALLCASPASATVLCKTAAVSDLCTGGTGSAYEAGTPLEASLKPGTKWSLSSTGGTVECEEATIAGEITGSGAEAEPVTGSITKLTFGKCNSGVLVLANGTFSIEHSKGSNGTLTHKGLSILTMACVWGGPASASLSGAAMSSIEMNASVPKTGGGEKCTASSATISAEYTVTSPEPLYVASRVKATVLCKVAEFPCPAESLYEKGQTIRLELPGPAPFTFGNPGPYNACYEVLIEGEITSTPGGGADVGGPITTLDFRGCFGGKSEVGIKGKFSIDYTSGGNGTLRLENFLVTVPGGCWFVGPAIFGVTGGNMASVAINSIVPDGCSWGTLKWIGELTVTEPEPLYVSEF